MHVALLRGTPDGPVEDGRIDLDPNGNLAPSNEVAQRILAMDMVVGEPGKAPVTPADGERYLTALPFALHSPYLYAVLHD